MDKISMQKVIEDVARTLIDASVKFRPDQIEAYTKALCDETDDKAKWVLQNIIHNAEVGEVIKSPLCDDTGIPHLFLEIGNDVPLPAGFFKALEDGVCKGLRELPGRPMAVRGSDDTVKITQSEGMYEDPGLLSMAPLQMRNVPGDKVKLTLMMYGGGPEIRGKTQRIFHKHSVDVVKGEMIEWGLEGARLLGCQPAVLSFGVGRSNLEAASLSIEAMAKGVFGTHSSLEVDIMREINKSGIGPLGIGGKATVLGVFVQVGPQRASGVRVVSMRVGCCFDPRRATCTWKF